MDESVKILAIGDLHFKKNYIHRGKEVLSEIQNILENNEYDFVVILGDILNDHEVVDTTTFNLACNFIHKISEYTNVFLIIGNHDYINNTQFLSNHHPFNPLKKWKGVNIIDRPKNVQCKNKQFLMCPYVYPGRFLEAINTIDDWYLADCIFCHQEFKGCKMGAFISEKGDIWDESYPQVISGHIHDHQIPQDNIFYTGSAVQHGFNESSSKYIFEFLFENEEIKNSKIRLNVKNKKIITLDIDEIDSFDEKLLDKYEIKLCLKGQRSDFYHFRSSSKYRQLRDKEVKFSYSTLENDDDDDKDIQSCTSSIKNFDTILKEMILNESENVKSVYEEITSNIHSKNNQKEEDILIISSECEDTQSDEEIQDEDYTQSDEDIQNDEE